MGGAEGAASTEAGAVRQSRTAPAGRAEPQVLARNDGVEGVSPDVAREYATRFYHATKDDPLFRTLPVYALDPSIRRGCGAVTEIRLPYEPLEPGPCGSVFRVDASVADEMAPRDACLDDRFVLIDGGYRPDPADPRFHAQMVYAVAQATYVHFQVALGREPSWRIPLEAGARGERCRLVLRPFGARGQAQAWYDRQRGEVVFGFFHPSNRLAGVPDGDRGHVFLSLSHDVIVHEVAHALLDGLRPVFHVATHPDVPAFHEAFADLVAIFSRFTQKDIVHATLKEARGYPSLAGVLSAVGRQFGYGVREIPGALRTLYPEEGFEPKPNYANASKTDQHLRGNVLARAVFAAFLEVYEARATRFVRAATGGRSQLREEDLNEDLLALLVEEVGRIARQFIRICVRAVDYCPPVDLRFRRLPEGPLLRPIANSSLSTTGAIATPLRTRLASTASTARAPALCPRVRWRGTRHKGRYRRCLRCRTGRRPSRAILGVPTRPKPRYGRRARSTGWPPTRAMPQSSGSCLRADLRSRRSRRR